MALSSRIDFSCLVSFFGEGVSPSQYAEKLLKKIELGRGTVEELNIIIFILEAFAPIEYKLAGGNCRDDDEHVLLFWAAYLKRRFNYLANTPILQYQHSPGTFINRLCITLAGLCEPVLGRSRYQILFPLINSDKSDITLTNLNDGQVAITDIILSDDGQGFIEVENCLANALSQNGILHHTQLMEAEIDEVSDGKGGVKQREKLVLRKLTDNEKNRVVHHNEYTESLYQPMTELSRFKNNNITLGGCLRSLIDGLYDGSSHRESKHKSSKKGEAGLHAQEAIYNFTVVYNEIPEAMRNELKLMRDDHHDFEYFWNKLGAGHQERMNAIMQDETLSAEDKKLKVAAISAEFGECVHLTAGGLQGIWNNNQARLYAMNVDGEISGIANQVLELERRIKEYTDDLNTYLRQIGNGATYLPSWFDQRISVDELLIEQWFQHVAFDRFKQIMSHLALQLVKSPKQLLKLPLLAYLTEEQMRWLVKEYYVTLVLPIFTPYFSDANFKHPTHMDRSSILFDLTIQGMDELQNIRCLIGRLILSSSGIDMQTPDHTGLTRFNRACELHPELAVYMLKHMQGNLSDILNGTEEKQSSAMEHAVRGGCIHLIRALLDNGAQVNPSHLIVAIKSSKPQAFAFLYGLINQFDLKLLIPACENFNESMVAFLYEEAVKKGLATEAAQLMLQIGNSHHVGKVVQFVVDHTVLHETVSENPHFQDALQSAVNFADATTVKVLVQAGVDMHAVSVESGMSAYAAAVCHIFEALTPQLLMVGGSDHRYFVGKLLSIRRTFIELYQLKYPDISKSQFVSRPEIEGKLWTFVLKEIELTHFKKKILAIYSDKKMRTYCITGLIRQFDMLTIEQRNWVANHFFDSDYKPMLESRFPSLVKYENWDALMLELVENNNDLFYILFYKKGINRNYSDPQSKKCVLIEAARIFNNKMCHFILSHDDINLDVQGPSGETALMLTASCGPHQLFQLLMSKGARLDVVDHHGRNVYSYAVDNPDINVFKELLPSFSAEKDDNTFLSESEFSINQMVRLVNPVNPKTNIILLNIMRSNNITKLKLLLARGLPVDTVVAATGRSLLMEAVLTKQLPALYTLLTAGANVALTDANGNTAADFASQQHDKAMLDLLNMFKLANGKFDPNLVYWCSREDDLAVRLVDLLTNEDLGVKLIDVANHNEVTPLMMAASCGHKKHVELLLERGAFAAHCTSKGKSAADFARENKHYSICVLLGKHCLEQYYNLRMQGGTRNTIFGTFFGAPKKDDKISAVKVLLRILNGWESYLSTLKPDEKPDLATYLIKAATTIPAECLDVFRDSFGSLRSVCMDFMGLTIFDEMMKHIPRQDERRADREKRDGFSMLNRNF